MADSFFRRYYEDIDDLVDNFAGYSKTISRSSIENWLEQFNLEHMETGLKLLKYVNYYSNDRLIRESQVLYRNILSTIPWLRINDSYYSGLTTAGHSSGVILNVFRRANGLSSHTVDEHFIFLSELSDLYEKQDSYFFFLEDYVGTGESTLEMWKKIKDFVPNTDKLYLIVFIAHDEAIQKIENATPLKIITIRTLTERDKIFSSNNTYFTPDEKETLLRYCETKTPYPLGFGDCQSNVVFYYRAPDNTISILRANISDWKGLFLRDLVETS